MIKALLSLYALALIIAAASCTPRDDSNIYPHPVDSSNTWRVNNVPYRAASPSVTTATGRYQLNAATDTGAGVNSIAFYFNTSTPPSPGRFLVVGHPYGDTSQVYVRTHSYNTIRHDSCVVTGRDSVYAIVTVNNKIVHVTLPPAKAVCSNLSLLDTIKISANDINQ